MKQYDKVTFAEQDRIHHERESKLTTSSPWPDADVSFHYTNMDYPFLHTHQYWEFVFLIRGELDHRINGSSTFMKSNQAFLIRPQDNHSLTSCSNEPVIILNFMAKKSYADSLFASFNCDLPNRIDNAENLMISVDEALGNRIISETLQLQTSQLLSVDEKVVRCKLLFLELFICLMNQKLAPNLQRPEWLSDLLIKLENTSISNESIKQQIAGYTKYSYSRLSVLFKEYMGCTIWDYINSKRMGRAIDFLKHSNLKVVEIANQLGYEGISTFNHTFKKYYGISPTQYRTLYQRQISTNDTE